jgi:hypothetical protein
MNECHEPRIRSAGAGWWSDHDLTDGIVIDRRVPATMTFARSHGRSAARNGSSSASHARQPSRASASPPSRIRPRRSASSQSDWTHTATSIRCESSRREAPTPSMIRSGACGETSTCPARPWHSQAGGLKWTSSPRRALTQESDQRFQQFDSPWPGCWLFLAQPQTHAGTVSHQLDRRAAAEATSSW